MNNNFSSYNKGFIDGAAQRAAERPVQHTEETAITFIIERDEKPREQQLRREMKLKAFAGWAFLAGLCWGLTPYFFDMARAFRHSNSIGGEIIIPLIPFFCFLLHKVENRRKK